MNIVGKGIAKIDGMSIATGKPVYTDDLAAKEALVVKILRSPHPYAIIEEIDTKRALMVPGVECILTYKDVPNNRFTLAGQSYPEPSPYDRLILDKTVRYVGDEVAIIAAIDEKTALKAMKMIKVKYNVLKPVIDMEEAIDNESIIHTEDVHCNFDIGMERERNIVSKHLYEKGNVEEIFSNAQHPYTKQLLAAARLENKESELLTVDYEQNKSGYVWEKVSDTHEYLKEVE